MNEFTYKLFRFIANILYKIPPYYVGKENSATRLADWFSTYHGLLGYLK